MKIVKKKSLGQNFLKEEGILDKIIKAGKLSVKDNVLEIGPGEGALTKKLLKNVKRVVAIEKDERLKKEGSALQKLQDSYKNVVSLQSELKLYFEDILEVNLPGILVENNFDKNGYKVVANIPYYITGKILRLLFQQRPLPKIIVLLVQKEVADRVKAKDGRQSILSLSVQYYAKVEIIDYVSREAFEPAPKVDSAILRVVPFRNVEYNKKEEKEFFRIVKIGFSSPRKVLLNNLKNGLQGNKNVLEKIFIRINLDLNIRAEKLSIDQWKKLIKEIENWKEY